MKRTLRWLWAVYWARRYTRRVLFSERTRFLTLLRPVVVPDGTVIAYPDAWLHITPADVRRARRAMPDTPDLTLDAAIRRANQYTRKAIEKPDIGGFWDELAAFAIKNMKDEGHG